MRELIREFVRIVAEVLPISEPIYEFGAFQTPGQKGFADLRPIFQGKKYVGCDIRGGPGVDRILNLHDVRLPSESVGTVLILETLEHVEFPRKAMNEAHRILKPNGILVISSVMNFSIHNYPHDYWRFTPQAFESLLRLFASSFVGSAGEENFPHTVIGIGFRNTVPEKTYNDFSRKFDVWKNTWKISENNLPRIVTSAAARNKGYFKLDLGCGKFKRKGFIGIDIEKTENVDIICDLDKGIPFPDNSVDHIYCSHFLEHVQDPCYLISEMYRVCIPNAHIEIIIPLHEAIPGHITIFDEHWFHKNLDRQQFDILSSHVERKSAISVEGKPHSWTQQEIWLRVIRPSITSTNSRSSVRSKDKDILITTLKLELKAENEQNAQLKQALSEITSGAGHRLLLKCRCLKEKLLPLGSRRRAFYERRLLQVKKRILKQK